MVEHEACFMALSRIAERAECGVLILNPNREVLHIDEHALREFGSTVDRDAPTHGVGERSMIDDFVRDGLRVQAPGWHETRWSPSPERRAVRASWYSSDESTVPSVVLIESEDALNRSADRVRAAARGREIHRLARRLAHDVATPLNALHLDIVVLERLIAESDSPNSPEPRSELLGILRAMSEQVRRIDAISREFAEITAQSQGAARWIDLRGSIRRAWLELLPVLRSEDIDSELVVGNESIVVELREDTLVHALVNLQLAAVELLAAPRLTMEVQTRSDNARIVVSAVSTATRHESNGATDIARKRARLRSTIAQEDIEECGGRLIRTVETDLARTYEIEFTRAGSAPAPE